MDKLWSKAHRAAGILLAAAVLASAVPAQAFADAAAAASGDSASSAASSQETAGTGETGTQKRQSARMWFGPNIFFNNTTDEHVHIYYSKNGIDVTELGPYESVTAPMVTDWSDFVGIEFYIAVDEGYSYGGTTFTGRSGDDVFSLDEDYATLQTLDNGWITDKQVDFSQAIDKAKNVYHATKAFVYSGVGGLGVGHTGRRAFLVTTVEDPAYTKISYTNTQTDETREMFAVIGQATDVWNGVDTAAGVDWTTGTDHTRLAGWSETEDAEEAQYSLDGQVTPAAGMQLFTVWEPILYGYTIVYSYDGEAGEAPEGAGKGGSAAFGSTVTVEPQEQVTVGDQTYTLDSENSTLSLEISEDEAQNVLYVEYVSAGSPDPDQTVVLTFQAGEHGSFAAEEGETDSKTYNLLPEEAYPAAPDVDVESGWLLTGWYDAEGNAYKAAGTVGEEDPSVTYTAAYEEDRNGDNIPDKDQTVVLTFQAGEHGSFAAEEGETDSKTYNLLPEEAYPAAPDVDVESGWLLTGWYDAEGNAYKAAGTVGEEDSSVTYTAAYEEDRNGDNIPDKDQTYTVNYATDGNGTVTVNRETAGIQGVDGIQGSKAVANAGYTVDGWYKGNVKIADGDTLTPDVIKANLNTENGLYQDTTFMARFVKQAESAPVLTGYTVRYLEDGTGYEVASPKTVSGVAVGTTVTETAPDLAGYSLMSNKNPQSITLGSGDNVITFYYRAIGGEAAAAPAATPVPAALPVIPTTPTTPTAPAATRAPAAGPSVTAAPTAAPTEAPVEEETLPDEQTPQAQESAQDESIADAETPLAGSQESGWALLNLILAVVAVIGAVVMVVGYFMGHPSIWRLLSLIPGVGSVAAFLLTEDMSRAMTFVDGWTVLMGIIVIVQIVLTVMALRSPDPYEEEEAEDED